jgi:hypothetical protein
MALEDFLIWPEIPTVVKNFVRKQGFRTLDEVLLFLVNNPTFVQRQLKRYLPDTPLNPAQTIPAPDQYRRLINEMFQDPSLSPDVRDLVVRTAERFVNFPLGVPLHASDPGPGDPGSDGPGDALAPTESARDFVRAVEEKAKAFGLLQPRVELPRKPIDLTLPTRGWPVPNQATIPACIPYTLAGCIEVHLHRTSGGGKKAPPPVSARFLYRRSRHRHFSNEPLSPAFKKGGLKLAETKDTLAQEGICLEGWFANTFDMKDAAPTLEEFEGVNPDVSKEAFNDAKERRFLLVYEEFKNAAARPPGLALKICDLLAAGHPVAVTIPGFTDPAEMTNTIWHASSLVRTGILPLPSPDHICGPLGHAVCVLGYFPDGDHVNPFKEDGYQTFPGYFLFRNSWGPDFPNKDMRDDPSIKKILGRDLPEGYGLIPATVMEYFVWEYGIVKPIP